MRNYNVMRPFNLLSDIDKFFYSDYDKSEWKPLSRVKEEDGHYHLALDIPGVDKEHLKVELKDQLLSISGERKDHFSDNRSEYNSVAKFEQHFSLPKDSNLDEIEVHQNNGVLDVVIPKAKKNSDKRSLNINHGRSELLK